jgi:hypothetical protein
MSDVCFTTSIEFPTVIDVSSSKIYHITQERIGGTQGQIMWHRSTGTTTEFFGIDHINGQDVDRDNNCVPWVKFISSATTN